MSYQGRAQPQGGWRTRCSSNISVTSQTTQSPHQTNRAFFILTNIMSTSLLKQYHLLRRTTSPCSVSLPIAPWQTYMNQASDNWMRQPENAGKAMSIHTIPQLVSYAFPKALTPENITEGFRATGIYPFDRNIFPPHKFISCYSSDRPPPWKHGISDETTMSQAQLMMLQDREASTKVRMHPSLSVPIFHPISKSYHLAVPEFPGVLFQGPL